LAGISGRREAVRAQHRNDIEKQRSDIKPLNCPFAIKSTSACAEAATASDTKADPVSLWNFRIALSPFFDVLLRIDIVFVGGVR
jgi:hypothetical protein